MTPQSFVAYQANTNSKNGWDSRTLDQGLIEMKSGFACARKYSVSHGLPHLRPFNVGLNGELDLSEIIYIPEDYQASGFDYNLCAGDLLFNNTNSVDLVGKTSIVREDFRCAFSNHITRLRVLDKNRLDPAWLLLCLRVYWQKNYFAENCNRWIGQAGFTPTKLAELSIPLPELRIQRRIVARIEALLAEVQSSRELLDKMRQDCDRLLAVSLTDVLNKLESVIDIVTLKEVATAFNGRASGSGISSVRVFKTRHVYPHKLRLNDPSYAKPEQAPSLPAERFLKPGDILMANIAEGTLGRVSYVEEAEKSWTVDTQIMILRSKDENKLIGKWLYYYLWSERGQQEILSRRTGIAFADKRGQTHIYPKNVVEIPVLKPPINAQRQAVAYLDAILYETKRMAELIEQDAKTLDLLEQSILERAFRGEL
jgi:type I restriction enzyme S subunit